MSRSDNVLTGLFALNDAKLTASQRNRCLALFALQDNPFGMMSQWLYSKSLQRENNYSDTIANQQDDLKAFEQLLSELQIELSDHEHHIQDRDQTIEFQQSVIEEFNHVKRALYRRLKRQEEFARQLYLGKEVLLELIASQMNEIDMIQETKASLADEIAQKEEELQILNQSFIEGLMALKVGAANSDENADMIEALNQLTNLNEMLFQSLNEAMAEIQRLIGLNN